MPAVLVSHHGDLDSPCFSARILTHDTHTHTHIVLSTLRLGSLLTKIRLVVMCNMTMAMTQTRTRAGGWGVGLDWGCSAMGDIYGGHWEFPVSGAA